MNENSFKIRRLKEDFKSREEFKRLMPRLYHIHEANTSVTCWMAEKTETLGVIVPDSPIGNDETKVLNINNNDFQLPEKKKIVALQNMAERKHIQRLEPKFILPNSQEKGILSPHQILLSHVLCMYLDVLWVYFLPWISTIDQIFTLRKIRKNAREKWVDKHYIFDDTEAFDDVIRFDLKWSASTPLYLSLSYTTV